jgi:hypothetical protein
VPVVALPARRHFAEDWSQIVREVRGKIRKAVAGRIYASGVKGPRSYPGPYFFVLGAVLRLSASDTIECVSQENTDAQKGE